MTHINILQTCNLTNRWYMLMSTLKTDCQTTDQWYNCRSTDNSKDLGKPVVPLPELKHIELVPKLFKRFTTCILPREATATINAKNPSLLFTQCK